MKGEVIATIVAAALTALASIGGVLYSQKSTFDLERTKLEASRAADIQKERVQALSQFAEQFSIALARATYVLWQVEMMQSTLTDAHFTSYIQESKKQRPTLVAAEARVALADGELLQRIEPVIREFYRIDEQISITGPNLLKGQAEALSLLLNEQKRANSLESIFLQAIARPNEAKLQHDGIAN